MPLVKKTPKSQKNVSAEFMMLSQNIAELILDQGNMLRRLDAKGLKIKAQFGRIHKG